MGVMLSTLRPNMSQGSGEGTPDTKKVRIQSPSRTEQTRRDRSESDREDSNGSTQEDNDSIEFMRRLANGERLEQLKTMYPNVRHTDLLSSMHWVGLELNERVNQNLQLSALECAEVVVRAQIEHIASEKSHLLYVDKFALSRMDLTEDEKRPALTIATPGPTQVVVESNRVRLKTQVPGGLDVHYEEERNDFSSS